MGTMLTDYQVVYLSKVRFHFRTLSSGSHHNVEDRRTLGVAGISENKLGIYAVMSEKPTYYCAAISEI